MGYIQKAVTHRAKDFRMDNFRIDMKNLKAVCPAGCESVNAKVRKNGEIYIRFPQKHCAACEFLRNKKIPVGKVKQSQNLFWS